MTHLVIKFFLTGHLRAGSLLIPYITPERKAFAKIIHRRDKETIQNVLREHVLPGSILVTDCWKGYQDIKSIRVNHLTVNH